MTVPIYTCCPLLAPAPEPSRNVRPCLRILQHQQQVVQAVERAKQVTMAELNAVIGVRGLPGLPPTVCIPLISLPLQVVSVYNVCDMRETIMWCYSIQSMPPHQGLSQLGSNVTKTRRRLARSRVFS